MGKRSNFERNPRDYYPTPEEAVKPLIPHVGKARTFYEPCAGDGRLVQHLEKHGLTCTGAMDIEPMADGIERGDAMWINNTNQADMIITNPPWDRKILHPMIERFTNYAPTWLLFDADWMHTKQSAEHMKYCKKVVSIGRVKWFGNMTGKDNCCWYLFDNKPTKTVFIGR